MEACSHNRSNSGFYYYNNQQGNLLCFIGNNQVSWLWRNNSGVSGNIAKGVERCQHKNVECSYRSAYARRHRARGLMMQFAGWNSGFWDLPDDFDFFNAKNTDDDKNKNEGQDLNQPSQSSKKNNSFPLMLPAVRITLEEDFRNRARDVSFKEQVLQPEAFTPNPRVQVKYEEEYLICEQLNADECAQTEGVKAWLRPLVLVKHPKEDVIAGDSDEEPADPYPDKELGKPEEVSRFPSKQSFVLDVRGCSDLLLPPQLLHKMDARMNLYVDMLLAAHSPDYLNIQEHILTGNNEISAFLRVISKAFPNVFKRRD